MDPRPGRDAGAAPRAPRPIAPPPRRRGPRRITKSLAALSSAAILTVYAVGYVHTQPAEQLIASAANVPPAATTPLTPTVTTDQPPASSDPAPAEVQALPSSPTPAAPQSTSPQSASTLTPLAVPTQTGAGSQTTTSTTQAPPTAAPTEAPATVAPTQAPATPASTQAPTPVPTPKPTATSGYKDGTYSGVGNSRHGSIQVSLVVAQGRITSVQITSCRTRYPCSWVSQLPGEVLQTQSARVNYVSGATASSQAFMGAVASALAHAV